MKTFNYRIIFLCILSFGWKPICSFSEEQELKLTLQEALDHSLQANLSISVERFTPQIDRLEIKKGWGVFDPVLSMGLNYRDNNSPLTRQYSVAAGGLDSIEARDLSASGQLAGKIPTGTMYSFDVASTRDESTFNQFNPEYQPSVSVTMTQPLLKDFGTGSNLALIRISKNRYIASRLKFRQTVMEILSQAESAYWDLYFAVEDLKVKQDSLRVAQSLLDENRIRSKVGTLSALEVVQSEAGVAVREEALLDAGQRIRDGGNRLKRLIFNDLLSQHSILPIPVDHPVLNYEEVSVSRRIETALKNRLDLQQLKIELANENIFLKYYKNQALPRVDFEGSLGLNGLGGGFSNAIDDFFGKDHSLWGAGIVLRYPLGDRTGRANVGQSKLQIRKRLLELKNLENDIVIQVDTACGQLDTLWKKIKATEASEHFSGEALLAEKKKFDAGMSTPHNVLEFEEDLAVAKSNRLRTEVDYLKAGVELKRLEGTTLQSKNIEFVEESSVHEN